MVLIDEQTAKSPAILGPVMERTGITVWFSTPTILSWLAQWGDLRTLDLAALRMVIFSGESFPPARLDELMAQLPAPRYVHTLGSTETHMIARYELPRGQSAPPRIPVGRIADHFRFRIVDEQGDDVPPGTDGELWLSGPGVMPGYWRADPAGAFLTDATGLRWYRTRDIVRLLPDGNLLHRSRRDRVVKKRGNRIELGEVEACLASHAGVREVAVVALEDLARGLTLKAFVVRRGGEQPTPIQLKAHCSRALPSYMVPDAFAFPDVLPRTANGKVDFPRLQTR
jgi:acyl-coenzyme A synthetase/AMP-(fatty) acid ligase